MRKLTTVLVATLCLWTTTVSATAQQPYNGIAANPAPTQSDESSDDEDVIGKLLQSADGTIISHSMDGVYDYVADPNNGIMPAVEPRFVYFSSLTSRMVQSSGKSTCTGSVLPYGMYKVTLKLIVERSKDDRNWDEVKSWSSTQTLDSRFILEKAYYLTKGYSYRLRTAVTVVANGHVETAECLSSVVYY